MNPLEKNGFNRKEEKHVILKRSSLFYYDRNLRSQTLEIF
jgi:hypothetical protein